MIVAAVDTSASINSYDSHHYQKSVYNVLKTFPPPVHVIRWNTRAHLTTYPDLVPEMGVFKGHGGTDPSCFLRLLPQFTDAIQLHVFTDGEIFNDTVQRCKQLIKEGSFVIQHVTLYYIGQESAMNLKFIDVFEGIPQNIHINKQAIGRVTPDLNFDVVDYEYIMKDDSFKATIISHMTRMEHDWLKKKICELSTRILKDYFQDKMSIEPFYKTNQVDACAEFVKTHSYFESKAAFQRKISDILKLFDQNINLYAMHLFQPAESAVPLTIPEEPEALTCEPLTCDILYEQCQTGCIPIKKCKDAVWFEKDILQNPLALLASPVYTQRLVEVVEPFILDYAHTFQKMNNPTVSPFSRDPLMGVYVLHTDQMDVQRLIHHNNYVLSTLFQNTLPGKCVLWHLVFLYIMATKRFPEYQERFFEEIRFLSQQTTYFVTLNPHLNPPFVETLNVCFWYAACVSPKAFPNSQKNFLRDTHHNPDVFLKFYRDVFDADYTPPHELPVWMLWKTLCLGAKDEILIFRLLAHYVEYEKLKLQDPPNTFNYILYNQTKPFAWLDADAEREWPFLQQLDVHTVWSVYKKFKTTDNPSPYEAVQWDREEVPLTPTAEPEDKLDHIYINLFSCHPLVICPITLKYWKHCIGEYDVKRESCLRLFRKYCILYKKYPKSSAHLWMYINQLLFKQQQGLPEFFGKSMKQKLDKVMKIFMSVKLTYSCIDYLKIANKSCSEMERLRLETGKDVTQSEYDQMVESEVNPFVTNIMIEKFSYL